MTAHPSSLILALLLAGCSRDNQPSAVSADTKLRGALVGTWVREGNGTLKLAADGSFSARWTNAHSSPVWIRAYEGTWKVANGACVTALTNSQSWGITNRQAVGSADTWHVISVADGELILGMQQSDKHIMAGQMMPNRVSGGISPPASHIAGHAVRVRRRGVGFAPSHIAALPGRKSSLVAAD